jgi:hypothetical protein
LTARSGALQSATRSELAAQRCHLIDVSALERAFGRSRKGAPLDYLLEPELVERYGQGEWIAGVRVIRVRD